LNDVFEVRFGDVHYSRQKLTEVVPAQKVVWRETDSRLNFLKDKSEWTDTQIRFDIAQHEGCTQVRFTTKDWFRRSNATAHARVPGAIM
jgi:Holliday junction resolvase-like predicted endonuclease